MIDESLVKQIRAKAHSYENFSGCTQAVLLALQEDLKIGDLQSYKAATAFAGGVGRRGETCGALIGALMGLGLEMGREKKEDTPKLNETVTEANIVIDQFLSKLQHEYGWSSPPPNTICRDLQQLIYGRKWKMTDLAERQSFIAAGGHSDQGCLKVCGIAAEAAAEEILRLREKQ